MQHGSTVGIITIPDSKVLENVLEKAENDKL